MSILRQHAALILGCGPTGLLAAHAARLNGWRPIVVSVKRKSNLFGCQYLHAPIPELTASGNPKMVHYILRGSAEDYAAKVYGPDRPRELEVSPQTLMKDHEAWDIRAAYEELWARYARAIVDHRINFQDINPMLDFYQPDLFFSSLPAPQLCVNEKHDFKFTKCYAIGDAPEYGQFAPKLAPPFTVVCDGTERQGYYRVSNVFGYSTVEWPGWGTKPPMSGVVEFQKPLSTDCDCNDHVGMMRIGRMGQWKKGVLAHHAFEQVMQEIKNYVQ